MAFERVVFTIPKDLLCELDSAILTDHVTRSQYIREAIILKMQLDNSFFEGFNGAYSTPTTLKAP